MPLRRADPIARAASPASGPRLGPLVGALAVLVLLVAYGVPLATTGDPFWFVPNATRAARLDVHWEGAQVSILPGDRRYQPLMDALNDALSSPTGIELQYGLRPADVDALRASGRALEAVYAAAPAAHSRYALGSFTRVLVPFDGAEYERRLVFVGDATGYRAGPIRSPTQVERLDELARAAAVAP